jgi:hypothetical protein
MCDLKKWFLKTQLSIWQNHRLAFKILYFQKSTHLPTIWKNNFLRFQIAIFKKCNSQKVYFLRFNLKSHFLSMKSQFKKRTLIKSMDAHKK